MPELMKVRDFEDKLPMDYVTIDVLREKLKALTN